MSNGINERPYLSIGEVLGLLLEEFPDVTISKIRFLESQGLIEPERTSSGYRKFFDADIDRLRVILREQRENFLPLRVIRDRLETGEIDDSGAIPVPAVALAPTGVAEAELLPQPITSMRGIRNVTIVAATATVTSVAADDHTGELALADRPVVTARHPAAQGRVQPVATAAPVQVLDRVGLCAAAAITPEQLDQLESYGVVVARGSGASATYTSFDVDIARAAAGFLQRGIDARHLRGWRQAADREVGLFDQRVLPLLRQRNPQARQEAITMLADLADLGGQLRAALVASLLRHHLD